MLKKIYYHDTDSGGVVYYANYLKYLEEARTEYMSKYSIDLKKISEDGIFFVVKKVEIDYKSPARYGDIIEIFTKISKVRNVSIEFYQEIKNKDKILILAKTILVCVNRSFQLIPIPQYIIERLNNVL
ncbi:MAG: thioesterase family protein [Candidatus Aenigmatarchaeota archaeon]